MKLTFLHFYYPILTAILLMFLIITAASADGVSANGVSGFSNRYPGQTTKSFELPWVNNESAGQFFSTKTESKKAYVISTFFDRCGYCHENAPRFHALSERYTDDASIQFLDIGVDDEDADFHDWISTFGPRYPVLKDPFGRTVVVPLLKTDAYPTMFVLNCRLEIVATAKGLLNASKIAELTAGIQKALSLNCK